MKSLRDGTGNQFVPNREADFSNRELIRANRELAEIDPLGVLWLRGPRSVVRRLWTKTIPPAQMRALERSRT
jgi:hypothetical protein